MQHVVTASLRVVALRQHSVTGVRVETEPLVNPKMVGNA